MIFKKFKILYDNKQRGTLYTYVISDIMCNFIYFSLVHMTTYMISDINISFYNLPYVYRKCDAKLLFTVIITNLYRFQRVLLEIYDYIYTESWCSFGELRQVRITQTILDNRSSCHYKGSRALKLKNNLGQQRYYTLYK